MHRRVYTWAGGGNRKGERHTVENRGIGYTNIYRCMEWCLENNTAYESIHCSSHLYTTSVKWCMDMIMMSTPLRVTNPIHTYTCTVCMYVYGVYIHMYVHTYIYIRGYRAYTYICSCTP